MTLTRKNTLTYTAALALLYAVIGIPPMASSGCDSAFVWDPEAEEWRPATPEDQADQIHNLAEPVVDALQDTPAAGAIPWIETATRVLAVLVAFRWSKPQQATPPAKPSP